MLFIIKYVLEFISFEKADICGNLEDFRQIFHFILNLAGDLAFWVEDFVSLQTLHYHFRRRLLLHQKRQHCVRVRRLFSQDLVQHHVQVLLDPVFTYVFTQFQIVQLRIHFITYFKYIIQSRSFNNSLYMYVLFFLFL